MTNAIQNGAQPAGIRKLAEALEARSLSPAQHKQITDLAELHVGAALDSLIKTIGRESAAFGPVKVRVREAGGEIKKQFDNAAVLKLPEASQLKELGKELRRDGERALPSVDAAFEEALRSTLKQQFGESFVAFGMNIESDASISVHAVISGAALAAMPEFKQLGPKSSVDLTMASGSSYSVD